MPREGVSGSVSVSALKVEMPSLEIIKYESIGVYKSFYYAKPKPIRLSIALE